jgi:3-deoxy-manno-octulosonate cytidylyltransferase (CMP-KDO synthetase)
LIGVIIAIDRAASRPRGPSTAGILGVIPARLASERLPRKPLLRLAGRPLVEWVWRRALASGLFEELVVATESAEVAEVAAGFGATVALTRPEHASGTDRVAEVARCESYTSFDTVVNVQGDEPFVLHEHLAAAVSLVREGPWEVGTVATPVASVQEWRDPSAVKVVLADDGGALYFSRSPIPSLRGGEPGPAELASGRFLRHVGVYAYRRAALLRWVALPAGRLECDERLEQLRPLAGGIRIGVAIGAPAPGGIDTPEDARRAESLLHETSTDVPGKAPA